MYNEDIKCRYISVCNLEDASPFEVLFEKSEYFEEDKGKDLYDFTKKELVELLKFEATSSMQQLIMLLSRIRTYTQWALEENLVWDGMNHTNEIDTDVLISCLQEKMIFTREQILHRINFLTNDFDKFIVLAVFEGIQGKNYEDLGMLTINDFRNGEVFTGGKHFKVSSELLDLAYWTNENNLYYTGNGKIIKFDMEDHCILKKFVGRNLGNATRRGKRVYIQFYSKIKEEMKLPSIVTLKDIYLSGLIHKIKEVAEREKKSEKEVIYNRELMDKIEEQYFYIPSKINFIKRYF